MSPRRSTSGAARRTGGSPSTCPAVRLVAVVRDPIDRAYSNWMHLWSDGLERVSDFEEAFALQQERVDAGWAPFWRYRDLGLYGEQLRHLYDYVRPRAGAGRPLPRHRGRPRGRPWTRSARSSASSPATSTTSRATTPAASPRPDCGARWWAPPSAPAPSPASSPHPQVWRSVSVPLTAALQAGDSHRPHLSAEARQRLVPHFAEDIALLSELTGEDFSLWLSAESRGSFRQRAHGGLGVRRTSRDPRGPAGGLHLPGSGRPDRHGARWRAAGARPGPRAAGSTPRRRRAGTGRRSSYRRGRRHRSGPAGPTGWGRTGTTARGCRPRASAPRCSRRTAAAGPAGRSGAWTSSTECDSGSRGGSSWQAAATDANVCWPGIGTFWLSQPPTAVKPLESPSARSLPAWLSWSPVGDFRGERCSVQAVPSQ